MLFCSIFGVFGIGQYRVDRKRSGRETGMGSGKAHELVLELGTPEACLSAAHEAIGFDYNAFFFM